MKQLLGRLTLVGALALGMTALGAVPAHPKNIHPLPTQRMERVRDYQRIRRGVT